MKKARAGGSHAAEPPLGSGRIVVTTLSWSWSELTPLLLLSPSSAMSGKEREDLSCERARWMSNGLIMPPPPPLDGVGGGAATVLLPPAAVGRNSLALCGSAEKLCDLER